MKSYSFQLCMAGSEDSDQKFIDIRMRAVRRKIVILSGKGGLQYILYLSHCVSLSIKISLFF